MRCLCICRQLSQAGMQPCCSNIAQPAYPICITWQVRSLRLVFQFGMAWHAIIVLERRIKRSLTKSDSMAESSLASVVSA